MIPLDFEFPTNGTIKDLGIQVHTTNNRGFTTEEHAIRCAEKIVSVSSEAHPAIRAQAHAFKSQVIRAVEQTLCEAVKSDRTTIYNALNEAGHPELADLIRRL